MFQVKDYDKAEELKERVISMESDEKRKIYTKTVNEKIAKDEQKLI
jgi:hypothetical protein